ncbi:MAG: hypothetical protein LBJ64_08030, partial [Deltaproteobacteria bacterium]|nr:hypothetical protein [Deltaproteobacteria bacterium]
MRQRTRSLQYYANPRRVAYEVVILAEESHHPEEHLNKLGCLLKERDFRLAAALVYEVLRHKTRLESVIEKRLSRGRVPSKVMTVLKIGLVQLMFLRRIPAFAAVNETVTLAKAVVPRFASLTNAVLAGLSRDREAEPLIFPAEPFDRRQEPAASLSIFYSHPRWLVDKILPRLGFRETRAFLAADNVEAPPTIRINPLRTNLDELAALLPFRTVRGKYSPLALIPETAAGRPDFWPGFADGLFAVQDEASQILPLLAGRPESVLDGCAGLGGKSFALASILPQAEMTLVDPSAKRLSLIAAEAGRLGLPNRLTVVSGDLRDEFSLGDESSRAASEKDPTKSEIRKATFDRPIPESELVRTAPRASLSGKKFDLVVIDPPCTSTGVIRRRPDVKWSKSLKDLENARRLQTELLRV